MPSLIQSRFRGFLPVVVDIETSGVNPAQHALLEIAFVFVQPNSEGHWVRGETFFEHVLPFEGGVLDEASLAFNQIDPYQPLRFAVDEKTALERLFKPIRQAIKATHCQRAVLVGHNAWFDLLFLKEAVKRTSVHSPFHAFTCFDTASLAALLFGQTVLARALKAAHIPFDPNEAHSAIYDAEKTADLFCHMVNQWGELSHQKKVRGA